MTQGTIDTQTFKALQDAAGADFVVDLVQTFIEEVPAMMAELRASLVERDAERFRRAAHSLKSNSNTFGATSLGLLARDLELSARERVTAGDPAPLEALEQEFARSATRLKEMARG
jgi:HPt (histidine-containing phosphotransfer) domain-containing protein